MRNKNQLKTLLIFVGVAIGAMAMKDKFIEILPKIPVVGDMLLKVVNPQKA